MADITVKAAYPTVADEDGQRFVGFVTADDEGYALFRQPLGGGPVWFEVSDETFGAEEAVERVEVGAKGIEITLAPQKAAAFGFARSVSVRIGAGCEDAEAAIEALRGMLGARMV